MRIIDLEKEGYRIIEAVKDITIYLNAQDFDNGEPGSPSHCAIANAVLRNIHKADGASIGASTAYIIYTKTKTIKRYLVKGLARSFVEWNDVSTPLSLGSSVPIILKAAPPADTIAAKRKLAAIRQAKILAGELPKRPAGTNPVRNCKNGGRAIRKSSGLNAEVGFRVIQD